MTRNWESMLGYGNASGNYLRLNVVQGNGESLGGSQPNLANPVRINRRPYPAPCQTKQDPLTLRTAGR
jgi:hypothetical protein